MTSPCPTRKAAAEKAVSLLCLGLFVFLQVLAAAPELHRCLHHDANQTEHQCAVTLLSQGNLHAAPALMPAVSSPVFVVEIPAHSVSAPVTVDYLLLPGRAPPA